MRIAILGHMGRDEAVVDRLMQHEVFVMGQWQNPGLVDKSARTGGRYQVVDSIKDTEAIADYVAHIQPDMFITNFDDALAAGVVDTIRQRVNDRKMAELLIPCPDKAGSQIEWDKFFLRQIVDVIDPKYNPVNFMATNEQGVSEAIDFFKQQDMEVAVKPRNLAGGKGVKVMGKRFYTHGEAQTYAEEVLNKGDQTGVEIQEKLEGYEFTLQIYTDGKTMIAPPTTFDYPYREDGDRGFGTGGMGSFSMGHGKVMPFMTQEDYSEAMGLMRRILEELKDHEIEYKGVLYPTFFKTKNGLKIVEINARGGDPELINVVDSMEDSVDLADVYTQLATGELALDSIRYKKLASTVIYLVSPEYGGNPGPSYEFEMDQRAIEELGVKIRFAAAERIGHSLFRTVGSSRTVALSALGATPQLARASIMRALAVGFTRDLPLDFRLDIASNEYIKKMHKN